MTHAAAPEPQPEGVHVVVVVTELDAPTQQALRFAAALRPRSMAALNVCVDDARTTRLLAQWAGRRVEVPLSSVLPTDDDQDPVLRHVDRLRRQHPRAVVMVVLPVVVGRRRWHRLLHRQPDPTLGRRLASVTGVMVVEVPWQLSD